MFLILCEIMVAIWYFELFSGEIVVLIFDLINPSTWREIKVSCFKIFSLGVMTVKLKSEDKKITPNVNIKPVHFQNVELFWKLQPRPPPSYIFIFIFHFLTRHIQNWICLCKWIEDIQPGKSFIPHWPRANFKSNKISLCILRRKKASRNHKIFFVQWSWSVQYYGCLNSKIHKKV